MDLRSELLHRRITLYRCYLREGARATEAAMYLRQLLADEAELIALAGKKMKSKKGKARSGIGRVKCPTFCY